MKYKSNKKSGRGGGGSGKYNKLDAKDKSFLKNYGQLHPINEIEYINHF